MYKKTVITINEGNINYANNDLVMVESIKELNTTIWNMSSNEINVLDEFISLFIEQNYKYIISYNNMTLEKLIVNKLHKNSLTISFAESCTGGMLASTIVNVSGSSSVFHESYVTYSEDAKKKILKVLDSTLKKHTVYSPEVAEEMVIGLYNKVGANICVSITGRAGGDEYSEGDGTYDFAILINIGDYEYMHLEHAVLNGVRNDVRKMQVTYIFWKLLRLLDRF